MFLVSILHKFWVMHFHVVQLLSCVWLFATLWTAASQASLSFSTYQFAQIHVHSIGDAIQPSHPLFTPSPPALNLSTIRVFPVSWLFASSGQSIKSSALAAVLPMNILGWFLSRLTVLISLLSKGLSRVFSSTFIGFSYLAIGGKKG